MEELHSAVGTRADARILIISDEPLAAKVWGYALNQTGLEVVVVGVAEPAIETWAKELPDLIVVEDSNDRMEELALLKQLRDLTVAPVLFLTSKTSEIFQLRAYQAGVDECIPLPITPRLFQAKVSAWLRRARTIPMAALDEVSAGGFTLNASQRRLTLPCGEPVRLTALEARALFLLMSHPGQSFTTEEVVEKVWGFCGNGDSSLLKHLIFRLRRKIEPNSNQPRHLMNDRGAGYRFAV